ncbi:MAG: squalene/phytoene synthase family protein [Anaerolineae bacterium]|nr:squalene/phytoene synthase family protein [Anaerolineae bacterium]
MTAVTKNIKDDWRPAHITRAASTHTYYTIRFLVDRDRVQDAYRAYAYFRWVDDLLDQEGLKREQRQAFVERQQALLDGCHQNRLTPEEKMLVELLNRETDSRLSAYLQNMMAVMVFDAHRRGRFISQLELEQYSYWLASAVTEAMHYFIGHDDFSPHDETRYFAVTAAHITHMLRDTCEDINTGYFNIPIEFLEAHNLNLYDLQSHAYRTWIKDRVQLAREYFEVGRHYLARVKNKRCRLAGYAYTRRFEQVLNDIEQADYHLQELHVESHQFHRFSAGAASLRGVKE